MPFITCKIDRTLRIPANFKGLTGRTEALKIEFKKDVPKEVSKKIADYYVKNWGKFFRYSDEPDMATLEPKPSENKEPKIFNAIDFLDENHDDIENALNNLEKPVKPKLVEICNVFRLTGYEKQTNGRIIERLVDVVSKKMGQDEKLKPK